MVANQIEVRGIADPRVLEALRSVPRHEFVPQDQRWAAYDDRPLSIGSNQTISQPYIVAYMSEKLQLAGSERVLEIGTGSGYQTAVLSLLASEVFTIETVEVLFRRAKRLLNRLEYDNVECNFGDGSAGLPEEAPFDGIIITAAAPVIPKTLCNQLASGGRMILPVGEPLGAQELVVVTRSGDSFNRKRLLGVRFVPMTGRVQRLG